MITSNAMFPTPHSIINLCTVNIDQRQSTHPNRLPHRECNIQLSQPSINSNVAAFYHVGAGKDLAILTSNVNPASGRIFYDNGTSEEVYYGQSNVLSNKEAPPFPAGVSIASSMSNALLINAGVGQAGIGLARFPGPITELYAAGGEGFYACLSP